MRRLWTVVYPAALAIICGVADGHAFLEQANPRVGSTVLIAPREVSLEFTQDLEPAFSSVTITDAAGNRVETGEPIVSRNLIRIPLRDLDAGTYRVTWRVLSVDTHTTQGAFTFDVRGP